MKFISLFLALLCFLVSCSESRQEKLIGVWMLKEMKTGGEAGLMQFNEDFTGVARNESGKGRTFKWNFDESPDANRLIINNMGYCMFSISEDGTMTFGTNNNIKPSTLLECHYLLIGNKIADSNLN